MTDSETIECPRCNSDHVMKLGNVYGKQGDKRQRYGCADCRENGRAWTFPEFYKRQFDNGDIHTCPQCESKGIDSNMIRRGIYKWGVHKGEQRFICTNDDCGHIEFEPIDLEKNSKPKVENSEPEPVGIPDEEWAEMGKSGKPMPFEETVRRMKIAENQKPITEQPVKKDKPIVEQPKEIDTPKGIKKENVDICPECGSELYIKNKKAICNECGEEFEWRD